MINTPCYLAGGAPFGPGVTSRNITPRANGLPANRTLAQFKELMRTGRDFAGGATPILQVMPWPVYGKMSDRELEAIYEFLRAIPMINPRPDFADLRPSTSIPPLGPGGLALRPPAVPSDLAEGHAPAVVDAYQPTSL